MKKILLIITMLAAVRLYAEQSQAQGGVLILSLPTASLQEEATTAASENAVRQICYRLGRLLPVEQRLVNYEISGLGWPANESDAAEIGKRLGVSVCIILAVGRSGSGFTGEMRYIPISPFFKELFAVKKINDSVTVQSEIPNNIPIKLARCLALLHENMPLQTEAEKSSEVSGEYIIKAGQWHGIGEGNFSTDKGKLTVTASGRYVSTGFFETDIGDKAAVLIKLYPNVKKEIRELDKQLDENTLQRYGSPPESRLFTGACIVNPASNACLPVYGSLLATGHLDFENPKLHKTGFALSLTALTLHLTLTEFLTGFKTNFFPWIRDADKTHGMLRLQQFLWCSVPLTLTAGFLDQLAFQMMQYQKLPPFFMNRNAAAGIISMLFPGGGLMYKGKIAWGWLYWASEMTAAGYGFYNLHNTRGRAAFIGLGIIKLAELVHAFAAEPVYGFYQKEAYSVPSLSADIALYDDDCVFKVGVTAGF